VHARQIGDKLYFTLTFYNNISSPSVFFHTIHFKLQTKSHRDLCFSGQAMDFKMWGDQRAPMPSKHSHRRLRIWNSRPLSYFEGETNLSINYSSWEKKGNNGSADMKRTPWLNLRLKIFSQLSRTGLKFPQRDGNNPVAVG